MCTVKEQKPLDGTTERCRGPSNRRAGEEKNYCAALLVNQRKKGEKEK